MDRSKFEQGMSRLGVAVWLLMVGAVAFFSYPDIGKNLDRILMTAVFFGVLLVIVRTVYRGFVPKD